LRFGGVLAGAILLTAQPVPAQTARSDPSVEDVDRAIAKAAAYIESQVDKDGRCLGEAPDVDARHGGKTALCAHALLTAGVVPEKSQPLTRAARWLVRAKLCGTYPVAMRACALADMKDPNAARHLQRDVDWLVKAMAPDGSYTYSPSEPNAAGETHDNSNAQMALLGVWAGARRGVEVPLAFWRRAEEYWLSQQQADGGWGYRADPRTMRCRSYGSMTAAGLASLYICFDMLRGEQFVRCSAPEESKAIEKGTAWLAERFDARENPRKGAEWQHYWLWCMSRVGQASGRRDFGGRDWHVEGTRALLETQNADGSWAYGDRAADTAFAMIFLVRGRQPLLMNKLAWRGKWNARPRDVSSLTRWLAYNFERPLGWQVVDANAALETWQEAPVLYVSGAGPLDMTREQLARLRTFMLRGGMVLSEAACNNGDFTLDLRKAYQRVLPEWPLARIPADHQVYSCHGKAGAGAGLFGVSNGVRLLAIHAPREISLAMQQGPSPAGGPTHDLLANLYVYATDGGRLRPRGQAVWPAPPPAKAMPRATVPLARLKYAGNWDPEPLGWEKLARLTEQRHNVLLRPGQVDIADLDAGRWPTAHITGTGAFTLDEAQTPAMRRFFEAGGTLLADAAGGSEAFTESLRKQVAPLVSQGKEGLMSRQYPLYAGGPFEIAKVRYRERYATRLADDEKTLPRLRVVMQDGRRPAVIFSPEDLSAGLVGYLLYGLAGYDADSAERLMTNMLFFAAGLQKADKGK
jgi:hypothetical protein